MRKADQLLHCEGAVGLEHEPGGLQRFNEDAGGERGQGLGAPHDACGLRAPDQGLGRGQCEGGGRGWRMATGTFGVRPPPPMVRWPTRCALWALAL